MTHRQIEDALGRLVLQDRDGVAIGISLEEVATLALIKASMMRLVAYRMEAGLIEDAPYCITCDSADEVTA